MPPQGSSGARNPDGSQPRGPKWSLLSPTQKGSTWAPLAWALAARQFSGWSPTSARDGRLSVLGMVARQFWGWSPAYSEA
jgi:hypothetical protein